MRILFTRFPLESIAYGGAENQTVWLVEGLIQRGHEVHVLSSCPALATMLKDVKGCFFHALDVGSPPVSPITALQFFLRKKRMQQILETSIENLIQRHGAFDAVCMLSLTEKILLTPHLHQNATPIYWIEHDPVGRWLTKNPWRRTFLRLSRSATLITVSPKVQAQYMCLGVDIQNIQTITNGVPPSVHPVHEKTSDAPLRYGFLGRLEYEKGIDRLLDAWKNITHHAVLDIVGKGSLLPLVCKAMQPDDRITYHDHISSVDDWYDAIDVLVLPSRNDPFGLVAAEAMMRGIPVLVMSIGTGIGGVIDDYDAAVIINDFDETRIVSRLSTALIQMKSNEFRTRIGQNGKKYAEKHFSLERMIDKYEKTFRRHCTYTALHQHC